MEASEDLNDDNDSIISEDISEIDQGEENEEEVDDIEEEGEGEEEDETELNDDKENDLDDELEKNELNKEEFEQNYNKQSIYNNSFIINDDLEINDSQEFLQKFDKEVKKDYIAINHQECLSRNLDEIKDLLNVIRDKDNIIIDKLHKTIPILTKYEKTRILGIRIKQLNNGSTPYIKVAENILDNFLIAKKELEEKKIPFIIQRPLPNNTFEYWKLQDLEIL
jgi:DNA-directed RNA polymerase subunit K/omega